MATLSHFPAFFSLSPRKTFLFPRPSLSLANHHCRCRSHTTIRASSIKKPRDRKKVRSDADLCNDLREFLSAAGLPEGHVPSLKELSQNGRQDLANIVRRRGYKLIRELLSASAKMDSDDSDVAEGLTEKTDATNDFGDASTGQDGKVESSSEDVSSEVSIKENYLNNDNEANIDHTLIYDDKSSMSLQSLTNTSLQEKVAKFIRKGELDTVKDSDFGILNDIGAEESPGFSTMESMSDFQSRSVGEEHSNRVFGTSDAAEILDGHTLLSTEVMPPALGNDNPKNGNFSSEERLSAGIDEEARRKKNQVQINHLKSMLHQKELELSKLKEQIKKEQLALSILQAKAETEITNAKKLILEKDAELQAAEESVSGLEEVEIQYWGEGETVEVAGSFNGWHHRIKMDPQPSPNIIEPIGSRQSRLWTTVLWLYPGIYEIKFIVDGHWTVDPQRELITRGAIENNILRVKR